MPASNSNTGALLSYTAEQLLEEACSRAGVAPEQITGEIVFKALDQLNLILTQLPNRGIQLWMRQQVILPLYEMENQVPLPAGVNTVQTLNLRTLARQTGTAFTDQGGTASLAFDDDFDTACTQTAVDGAIGCQFSSATQITTVGLLAGTAGEWGVFFEWSDDGVTYTTVGSATVTFTEAGEWLWFDLQGTPFAGATYWRVRSTGDVPFSLAELYFGNTPNEIYLGPWNLDDYSQMPNKFATGQVVNYYQQRNVSAPLLYVWPTPSTNERYQTLVCWVSQYLDQVTELGQDLPLPPRWYEALTAMLARKLCVSLKEAKIERYEMLTQMEGEAIWLAQAEERDNSPVNYDLGVSAYTA